MFNCLNEKHNRREVVTYTVLAAAGAAALVGCGETNSTNEGTKELPPPYPITTEQAETTIDSLVQSPDLYKGREYADPNILFGMTPEELADIAPVYVTSENQTNEGFAEDFRQALNRYFVAGQEMASVKDARSKGYPIGERDEFGNNLGKYSGYVQETYGKYMEDSLFVRTYNGVDTTETINVLRGYQTWAAQKYQDDLIISKDGKRSEPSADGTVESEVQSIKNLTSEMPEFDKRLEITVLLRRPMRDSKDTLHLAVVDCYIKEGQGKKYDIVLRGATVQKYNPASE